MKKFTVKDETFKCEYCGEIVSKLNYTSRNHCPCCLHSKHLDINPGDRKNTCEGLLEPISIEKYRDSYKIIFKCTECNTIVKNKCAIDDNMDLIINLFSNPN